MSRNTTGMTVLVAQLGARRHYAAPRALHLAGRLDTLVTDLCADGAPWRTVSRIAPRFVRKGPLRRILARRADGVPAGSIANLTFFALSPHLHQRRNEARNDFWARRNSAFCRAVAKRGFGAAKIVYAYNGAALEIFEAAKAQGLRTVLDQTAAPWRFNRALLEAEAALHSGWEENAAEIDTSGALSRREEAEWRLADRIICGSAFAARALAECGGPAERAVVIPYGGHVPANIQRADARAEGPLRVLFAGALQLRKGLPYLAEAMSRLAGPEIEFRLAGKNLLTADGLARLTTHAEWVGIVPRSAMAEHYAWADVFVLPTLSEGSANVVYEAMAAGLAVITTANAGSIVRDGETGLIIPSGNSAAIAAAIERLARDPTLRRRVAHAAAKSFAQTSLAEYSGALDRALQL